MYEGNTYSYIKSEKMEKKIFFFSVRKIFVIILVILLDLWMIG